MSDETLSPGEVGRLLASYRRSRIKDCQVCGMPFPTAGRGLYCSPKCRQRAAAQVRQTAAAERRAKRTAKCS